MREGFDFLQLTPYINDLNVTDINFNGRHWWIDDLKKGRYRIEHIMPLESVEKLCYQLSNFVNQSFNALNPIIEAETHDLRMSILHPTISKSGYSISIRKTPALLRFNKQLLIESNYASEEIIDLLIACVKIKCNILVSGLPGAGKTELVKYLTSFIDDHKRVITIEDTLELRYSDIHKNKDSVMIKVSPQFSYADAIKASLRQRPDWLLVSEVRGKEVVYLLQAISTGASVMTTVHADSAKAIPTRLLHMFPSVQMDNQIIKHNIYETIDIGIHLESVITDSGIHRRIREVYYYDLVDGKIVEHCLYRFQEAINPSPLLNKRLGL